MTALVIAQSIELDLPHHSDSSAVVLVREAVEQLFLDGDFVGRLAFVLGGSSNGDVLDSASRGGSIRLPFQKSF